MKEKDSNKPAVKKRRNPWMLGNQFAVGNAGNYHLRKYATAEEMAPAIDGYFQDCIDNDEPFLVTGLALFLGFASKNSLYEYQKRKEFAGLIGKALSLVERGYETNLHGTTPTGSIFALKNIGGWTDRMDTNVTITDVTLSMADTDEPEETEDTDYSEFDEPDQIDNL